jgi:hypothetical protein
MAISVLQSARSSGSGVAFEFTTLGQTTIGSVVFVQAYQGTTSVTSSITDNSVGGQIWVPVGTSPLDSGTNLRSYLWYTIVASPFTTVTCTASGTATTYYTQGIELAGVDTSSLFDDTESLASGGAASPGVTMGTLTTTAADRFLLTALHKNSTSEAFDTQSGWTATPSGYNAARWYYRSAPTATTYDIIADWASSTNRSVNALAVALKAASSSTPARRLLVGGLL